MNDLAMKTYEVAVRAMVSIVVIVDAIGERSAQQEAEEKARAKVHSVMNGLDEEYEILSVELDSDIPGNGINEINPYY